MKIYIPSRERQDIILTHSLRMFPDAVVVVAEKERDAYHAVLKSVGKQKQLMLHPDPGSLPKIFNWILDNTGDSPMAFAGDDLTHLLCLVGWRSRKIKGPDEIMQLVDNVAEFAGQYGAGLFGFNNSANPINFKPQTPYGLEKWVCGILGVYGRDLRFDENLLYNEDVDISLQSLMKHRVVVNDTRFYVAGGAEKNSGGLQSVRSPEITERQLRYLEKKWGKYINVVWEATTYRLQVRVKRKQDVSL